MAERSKGVGGEQKTPSLVDYYFLCRIWEPSNTLVETWVFGRHAR